MKEATAFCLLINRGLFLSGGIHSFRFHFLCVIMDIWEVVALIRLILLSKPGLTPFAHFLQLSSSRVGLVKEVEYFFLKVDIDLIELSLRKEEHIHITHSFD